MRTRLGAVFRELAQERECIVHEGHLVANHVHMLIPIPPKYSVSSVIGCIKGKSAIWIARNWYGSSAISAESTSGPGASILDSRAHITRKMPFSSFYPEKSQEKSLIRVISSLCFAMVNITMKSPKPNGVFQSFEVGMNDKNKFLVMCLRESRFHVTTVGRDEAVIRNYIASQEQRDQEEDRQMGLPLK